jgi:hypothetical protein
MTGSTALQSRKMAAIPFGYVTSVIIKNTTGKGHRQARSIADRL